MLPATRVQPVTFSTGLTLEKYIEILSILTYNIKHYLILLNKGSLLQILQMIKFTILNTMLTELKFKVWTVCVYDCVDTNVGLTDCMYVCVCEWVVLIARLGALPICHGEHTSSVPHAITFLCFPFVAGTTAPIATLLTRQYTHTHVQYTHMCVYIKNLLLKETSQYLCKYGITIFYLKHSTDGIMCLKVMSVYVDVYQ